MPPVNRGQWLARSRSVPVFPTSSWMQNVMPIPSRTVKLARTSNTELAHGNNNSNTQRNQGRTSTDAQVAAHPAPSKATTFGQGPKVTASRDKDPHHPDAPSEQSRPSDISSYHSARQSTIKTPGARIISTSENFVAQHVLPTNATVPPKSYTPPTPISRLTPVNRRAPKHLRPVPSLTFTNLGLTQTPTPPSRSSPQRPLSQNISAPTPIAIGLSEVSR